MREKGNLYSPSRLIMEAALDARLSSACVAARSPRLRRHPMFRRYVSLGRVHLGLSMGAGCR